MAVALRGVSLSTEEKIRMYRNEDSASSWRMINSAFGDRRIGLLDDASLKRIHTDLDEAGAVARVSSKRIASLMDTYVEEAEAAMRNMGARLRNLDENDPHFDLKCTRIALTLEINRKTMTWSMELQKQVQDTDSLGWNNELERYRGLGNAVFDLRAQQLKQLTDALKVAAEIEDKDVMLRLKVREEAFKQESAIFDQLLKKEQQDAGIQDQGRRTDLEFTKEGNAHALAQQDLKIKSQQQQMEHETEYARINATRELETLKTRIQGETEQHRIAADVHKTVAEIARGPKICSMM